MPITWFSNKGSKTGVNLPEVVCLLHKALRAGGYHSSHGLIKCPPEPSMLYIKAEALPEADYVVSQQADDAYSWFL